MPEDKTVNKAQFLKNLQKHKSTAAKAVKTERPPGILDPTAVMSRLGLEKAGDSVTIPGRVTKITYGYAKNDTDRPYFQFGYALSENSLLSDKGRGLILSNYYEVSEGKDREGEVFRTMEQAEEYLFHEFQDLGEDTSDWAKDPFGNAVAAAEKHTKDKTELQLTISCYESKRNPGTFGVNYRVVNVLNDNSDLGDDEEETDDDVAPFDEWVGGWVKWTDDEGTIEFKVTAYDEENDAFSGVDAEGDEWTDAPTASCEWSDDQHEDQE